MTTVLGILACVGAIFGVIGLVYLLETWIEFLWPTKRRRDPRW